MIDKASGRIAYAVLSFGGFLGIGDRYYPLPWEKLNYNTEMGGYVVDIDRETLEGAHPTPTPRRVMERRRLGPRRLRALRRAPFWDVHVLNLAPDGRACLESPRSVIARSSRAGGKP